MVRTGLFFLFFLLAGCSSVREIEGFKYVPLKAGNFELASWVKITRPGAPLRIYIEGDGFAWRDPRTPSDDPTPKDQLVLNLARADSSPNIVYLARPCQYVSSFACRSFYWTKGRFSEEVIDAVQEAVLTLMQKYKAPSVELVGYSGGGAVAALTAVRIPSVTCFMTVAGVLNHQAWTSHHGDTPLDASLNPASYRDKLAQIKQIHFVGALDKNVPPELTEKFVHSYKNPVSADVIIVPNAGHISGWREVWPRLIR